MAADDTIDAGLITPVWRQLHAILLRRIRTGAIPPGRALPSEPRLEQEFGLSRNTIRKAISQLRSDGWVVTSPGRGTFVSDPLPPEE